MVAQLESRKEPHRARPTPDLEDPELELEAVRLRFRRSGYWEVEILHLLESPAVPGVLERWYYDNGLGSRGLIAGVELGDEASGILIRAFGVVVVEGLRTFDWDWI